MNSCIYLFAVALMAAISVAGSVCVPVHSGESVKISTSRKAPACLLVEIAPADDATQLVAQQPQDLEIDVTDGHTRTLSDGFEFGPETATILNAGTYRVSVRPLDAGTSSLSLTMSRKVLPLQQAARWRNAENLATNSKHTGTAADAADSLEHWKEIGDQSSIARTYLKQGDAALTLGEMAAARAAYEQASELCRSLSDVRCAAEAANNVGFVAQQSGDFDAAANRLAEAAEDWRRLHQMKQEAITLSNMGLLYWYTNDFERAISLDDQAGRILRSRDRLANARVMNNIGLCYQSLAEYSTANRYFERAIAIESALPAGARAAVHARLNLGRNHMLAGETVAAQRILEEAVKSATALVYNPGLADALRNLGQNLLDRNAPDQARSALEKALSLHRALGDQRMEASDLHYLGEAALANGESAVARAYLTQALEIRRRCGLREAATDSLFSLAVLDRDAGQLTAARDLVEQAVELLESVRSQVPGPDLRASYYARKRKFFDLLVDIEMAPNEASAAERGLLASERGRARALLDILAEGSLVHQIPQGLLERRTQIQRQIDLLSYRLSTAPPNGTSGDLERIEELLADDHAVEARIRETDVGRKFGTPLRSVSQLREQFLPRDSALVEYHLAEPHSYAWLVQKEGTQVYQLPSRSAVEAQSALAIDLFSRLLDRRRSVAKQTAFERAIRQLSQTLLGPFRDSVLPRQLIIVPDGILNQVPFAALQLPPGNGRLGLAHDLTQVPAAAFLAAGTTPRSAAEFPQAILGIADPVFSPDDPRVSSAARRFTRSPTFELPRLPFTAELETVIETVPASRRRILRGFDASSDTIRKLRLEDYSVLHFSTHAVIDDRVPELSRIALSMVTPQGQAVDGFLHPYHLAEFRLNGSTVVLSACDTALGKQVIGEGLAGLVASLFEAGAAQLVLSLSEVDAEASAQFFSVVYSHLLSPRPSNMEHSLALARRELAHSPRWSDPYYWASFIVRGRPSELR
jgi:CHAT domain-containing protein/Tfp pilus assembly protein PilF